MCVLRVSQLAHPFFYIIFKSHIKITHMFKKFDQWVDRALDKKWVRVTLLTALIVHTILACIGWIVLAIIFG